MCLIQASDVHTQQYFFSGLVSDSMWPKKAGLLKIRTKSQLIFGKPRWIAPLYGRFHIKLEAEPEIVP